MKKLLILLALISLGASAKDTAAVNLKCVGTMTEQYQGQPQQTYQNIVRYYEFSQNKVVEHIGPDVIVTTRKELESGDSPDRKHSGYYRLEPLVIAFSDMYSYDKMDVAGHRTALIDRQTGKWSVTETYRGAVFVETPPKTITINGQCEKWNSQPKF